MPRIRLANEDDVPALLQLMRALAEFEGYADRFAVTEATLLDQGFRRTPPDFECFIAESGDGTGDSELVGMLVFYMIPFTFRARPTLFVKELYVAEAGRNRGVGEALMRAAAVEAVRRDCGLMKWQVACWNVDARRFYERLGASADPDWVDYSLSIEACTALSRNIQDERPVSQRPPPAINGE